MCIRLNQTDEICVDSVGQKWILPLRELQPNVGADSISARNGNIRPKWEYPPEMGISARNGNIRP